MGLSDWWEEITSSENFSPQRALRQIKKENPELSEDFDKTFLNLAEEEQKKNGRQLYHEELDSLAFRAKIQARHQRRANRSERESREQEQKEEAAQAELPKEIYARLNKQLQSIKTTINPFLSDGELGMVRNLKLKTAEDNILKILEELSNTAKARDGTHEMERSLRLEITRWTELTNKIHARLYKKLSTMEFKDYVTSFDQSFQKTRP